MRTRTAALVLLTLAGLSSLASSEVFAQAVGLDERIVVCRNVTDDTKRLACFDAATANSNDALGASGPVAISKWNVREDVSQIDDSKSVFLNVEAGEPYADDYGQKRLPSLWIRCVENKTSLYVDFDGDYMSDVAGMGTVTVRVGTAKAKEMDWSVSTDNAALGYWSGGAAIPLIKSMLEASNLLVRAVPVSASPVTVNFPIAGLDEAVKPLRAQCGW